MGMHWESDDPARHQRGRRLGRAEVAAGRHVLRVARARRAVDRAPHATRTAVLEHAVSLAAGAQPARGPASSRRRRAPWSPATSCRSGTRSVPTRAAPSRAGGSSTRSTAARRGRAVHDAVACADSGCIWDLAGALGGGPTPNSTRAFAARPRDRRRLAGAAVDGGDERVVRAGPRPAVTRAARCWSRAARAAARCRSATASPATLLATFTDAEMGGGGDCRGRVLDRRRAGAGRERQRRCPATFGERDRAGVGGARDRRAC